MAATIDARVASSPQLLKERDFEPGVVPGSVPSFGIRVGRQMDMLARYHGLSKSQLIEFASDGIVVDVGCGQSDFLDWFKADALTIAIDRHEPYRSYQHSKGHRGILASGSDMSMLPADSVRLLHASFSLPFWAHSVTHARKVADEYVRVLEPGGIALVGAVADGVEHPEHEAVIVAHRAGMTVPVPWSRDFEPHGTIIRAAFYKRLLERDDITLTGHRFPLMITGVRDNHDRSELQMPNFLQIQKAA